MKTGNIKSVNVKASRYVFPVLVALVKYTTGQFVRTPTVYSVSVFMEFGLGKASVYKPPPPPKKNHRANIWILFSTSCLQRERSIDEFSSLSLILTTH